MKDFPCQFGVERLRFRVARLAGVFPYTLVIRLDSHLSRRLSISVSHGRFLEADNEQVLPKARALKSIYSVFSLPKAENCSLPRTDSARAISPAKALRFRRSFLPLVIRVAVLNYL